MAAKKTIKMYRALQPLDSKSGKINRNEIFLTGKINDSAIEQLIALGFVAEVATPPLSVLPDWQERAKALKSKARITTVEQLLSADKAAVAAKLETDVTTVNGWLIELASIFVVSDKKNCWNRS